MSSFINSPSLSHMQLSSISSDTDQSLDVQYLSLTKILVIIIITVFIFVTFQQSLKIQFHSCSSNNSQSLCYSPFDHCNDMGSVGSMCERGSEGELEYRD